MYTVPPIVNYASTQGVSQTTTSGTPATTGTVDSEFGSLMQGLLQPDSGNNVNEEELFAALVQERVYTLKGQQAGDNFKAIFDKHKSQNMGKNGYCFHETAARNALKEFQSSGGMSLDEANKIHSEAFEAAQLDGNNTALFDGIGGANDPTKATASMQAALLSAQMLLKKWDSGQTPLPDHALNAEYPALGTMALTSFSNGLTGSDPKIGVKDAGDFTPKGQKIDGNEGMLWKPFSHVTGKLIMLLPPSYTSQVSKITLRTEDGKKLEDGKYFSVGAGASGREKWVFKKPGDHYPENLQVQVKFKDGNVRTIHIAKPGKRYD